MMGYQEVLREAEHYGLSAGAKLSWGRVWWTTDAEAAHALGAKGAKVVEVPLTFGGVGYDISVRSDNGDG